MHASAGCRMSSVLPRRKMMNVIQSTVCWFFVISNAERSVLTLFGAGQVAFGSEEECEGVCTDADNYLCFQP